MRQELLMHRLIIFLKMEPSLLNGPIGQLGRFTGCGVEYTREPASHSAIHEVTTLDEVVHDPVAHAGENPGEKVENDPKREEGDE
jgi:hypothetical protein